MAVTVTVAVAVTVTVTTGSLGFAGVADVLQEWGSFTQHPRVESTAAPLASGLDCPLCVGCEPVFDIDLL